jgi:uncharacterized membrane protein
MRFRPRPFTIVLLAGALMGFLFASVSTYDFAMHLDRQVHDVHCSFVPGLTGTESGASGCQVTLVSPYSSVFRTTVWGGVPISLPAMGVFAFLLFFALELVLSNRQDDRRATGFLALATALPAVTSMIMGYLSLVELDAACKLCIGIYTASAISLAGGLGLWLGAGKALRVPADVEADLQLEPVDHGYDPAWVSSRGAQDAPRQERRATPAPHRPAAPASDVGYGYLAAAFGVGVLFVVVPFLGYLAAVPDHARFIGACGSLATTADEYGVMLELNRHPGKPPAIEVLDPLCPACRGFEQRLQASGLDKEMDRKTVLFPLDDTCNWMVDQAVHPGACAVSEALLCAGPREPEVLHWAFEHQEDIRAAAASDPGAAQALVKKHFPDLARCVGSPEVKSRLNRSLRWIVSNRLPVLTPQLYVDGVKLCDEDVDLGLDYMLSQMLAASQAGTLQATDGTTAAPTEEEPAALPAEPRQRPAAGASEEARRRPASDTAAGQPAGGAGTPAQPAGGERAGSQPAAGEEPGRAETPGAQPGEQKPGAEPATGAPDQPGEPAEPAEPAAPATGERGSAAGSDQPPAGSDSSGGETP